MFKFVVLSALLIAVAAESGFFSAPLAPVTYAATLAAPAITTYVQQTGSYIPASTVYSELTLYTPTYVASTPITTYTSAVLPTYAAPAYFIKKRSASILATSSSYISRAPLASTYIASAPLTTTYSALLPSASYYPPYYAGCIAFDQEMSRSISV
ncbi:unnamed protein product, partial [Iphiclides podalirius]